MTHDPGEFGRPVETHLLPFPGNANIDLRVSFGGNGLDAWLDIEMCPERGFECSVTRCLMSCESIYHVCVMDRSLTTGGLSHLAYNKIVVLHESRLLTQLRASGRIHGFPEAGVHVLAYVDGSHAASIVCLETCGPRFLPPVEGLISSQWRRELLAEHLTKEGREGATGRGTRYGADLAVQRIQGIVGRAWTVDTLDERSAVLKYLGVEATDDGKREWIVVADEASPKADEV